MPRKPAPWVDLSPFHAAQVDGRSVRIVHKGDARQAVALDLGDVKALAVACGLLPLEEEVVRALRARAEAWNKVRAAFHKASDELVGA